MIVRHSSVYIAILLILVGVHSPAYAEVMANQQALNQQQQNEARHDALATESKPLLSDSKDKPKEGLNLPEEQPCYPINQLVFENKNAVAHWLTFRDIARSVKGKCIGINGLKIIHNAVQNPD